ncbi:hypothetical protein KCTC52924_02641 [Arenibacter antarcticus]|uniref:Beta-lactamase-inhibitor-like, PepSY-like n=1 Tax=Arenibacter antarcticus TaxID=2040469 RepID=A0ABW5VJU7_9FLAO|nr:hypothetical protein [Arenibacter sp. H213]MCM4168940.1 hypothetical protein [Arenibacter sp. H213]
MKTNVFYVLIILFAAACQDSPKTDKKEDADIMVTSATEKESPSKNQYQDSESQKALYKALKKKTPLTGEQLLPIIPEHINGNTKIGEHRFEASNQVANGMYGSYDSPYNFWIEDGSGSRAIVRNFFDSLKFKNQGPEGTEYVYQEQDGYKTIAFLQPKIKRNQISFIYNNRFRISLEGSDSQDALWSYIDFENLKKLDQFK